MDLAKGATVRVRVSITDYDLTWRTFTLEV
jgi:hypothetical protein